MRDYGKVYTRFWLKQNVLSWSDSSKLLGLYLLTCPHCNLLGCFRLPIGYIASDLNWSEQKVATALNELKADDFLIRCDTTGWTMIRSFLKHNPIENPNQGKAAFRLLKDVPEDFVGMDSLLLALEPCISRLPQEFSSLFINRKPLVHSPEKISNFKEHNQTPTLSESVLFDEFWELQIRKEKKEKAKEEWNRLGLCEDKSLANEVIGRWMEQREYRLQYQDRTKTPLPHNWLMNKQWEDEYVRTDEIASHQLNQKSVNQQVNIEESNRRIAQSWADLKIQEVRINAGNR